MYGLHIDAIEVGTSIFEASFDGFDGKALACRLKFFYDAFVK
jgi:hypothetical protein